MMRRAIAWATVTLHIKQYTTPEDSLTHIDIEQTATGGIKGTTELRTLDWQDREHSDHMFGELKGKSRWIETGSAEWAALDGFMKENWLEGEAENAGPKGERHVHSFVVNEERGWTAEQIWGFAIVAGERYYARRIVVAKGDTVLKVMLVYDWQGKQ